MFVCVRLGLYVCGEQPVRRRKFASLGGGETMTWTPGAAIRNLPANWSLIRANVLTRDAYTCVKCGAYATDVDHIGHRDDHSLGNLRALCHACHSKRTAMQGGKAAAEKFRKVKESLQRPEEPHPGLLPQEGEG